MSHSENNIPSPPYTYNDYRIAYNEKCFFYNGGFDLVCLTARRKVGVAPGVIGKYVKTYPSPEVIDLIFKVCINYVNDKEYKEEERCEIKKYSFLKKTTLNVKSLDLKIKKRIIKITSEQINVKIFDKVLYTSEPFKKDGLKTYISSSLHFNKPNKFKISSKIIIDKKKNE